MRNLRVIYNRAIAEQRIHARLENPFAQVYTGVFETRKGALGKQEVHELMQLNPAKHAASEEEKEPDPSLRQAIGYFMFCFFAREVLASPYFFPIIVDENKSPRGQYESASFRPVYTLPILRYRTVPGGS